MSEPAKKLKNINDLESHKLNPNKAKKAGREAVEKSLKEYGAGRSILVDRNGQIIAGNTTAAAAKATGRKIRVIQTSGDELVVVQRVDLDLETDQRARELSIADNRSSELGLDWDIEHLQALDVDLTKFWGDKQIDRMLNGGLLAPGDAATTDGEGSNFDVIVTCDGESAQKNLLEKLLAEGYRCRALI